MCMYTQPNYPHPLYFSLTLFYFSLSFRKKGYRTLEIRAETEELVIELSSMLAFGKTKKMRI